MLTKLLDRRYRVIILPDLEIVDRGLTIEEATEWASTFSHTLSQANSIHSIAIEEELSDIAWLRTTRTAVEIEEKSRVAS